VLRLHILQCHLGFGRTGATDTFRFCFPTFCSTHLLLTELRSRHRGPWCLSTAYVNICEHDKSVPLFQSRMSACQSFGCRTSNRCRSRAVRSGTDDCCLQGNCQVQLIEVERKGPGVLPRVSLLVRCLACSYGMHRRLVKCFGKSAGARTRMTRRHC
jgi:hypothetical protein